MRNSIALVIAAGATFLALFAAAPASQPGPSTIEQCATLLPQGKTYTFHIIGTVDNTGAAPALSGEMSVTDGTEVNRSAETAAFGDCIAQLIR